MSRVVGQAISVCGMLLVSPHFWNKVGSCTNPFLGLSPGRHAAGLKSACGWLSHVPRKNRSQSPRDSMQEGVQDFGRFQSPGRAEPEPSSLQPLVSGCVWWSWERLLVGHGCDQLGERRQAEPKVVFKVLEMSSNWSIFHSFFKSSVLSPGIPNSYVFSSLNFV